MDDGTDSIIPVTSMDSSRKKYTHAIKPTLRTNSPNTGISINGLRLRFRSLHEPMKTTSTHGMALCTMLSQIIIPVTNCWTFFSSSAYSFTFVILCSSVQHTASSISKFTRHALRIFRFCVVRFDNIIDS